MWYANIIGAIVVFILGVFITIVAWHMPFMTEYGPGGGFMPFWLGIIMVLCAIPLIFVELKNKDRSKKFFVPETITCVKVLVLIVAIYLIIPIIGFSVALALITATGMRIIGKHSWKSCIVTLIVTAIFIHYFGSWLNMQLPKGMIGW